MSPRRITGFRVTDRDVEIVRWLGRLRMATAEQVAGRFELGRAVSYARLRGLVRLGLLEHQRVFHASPGVYLATKRGLDLGGVDLPPAKVDVRTYEHDVELSGLVAGLEKEFDAKRLVTEREIRAADTSPRLASDSEPRFAVRLQGGHGQLHLTPVGYPRLHVPDCAVVGKRGAGSLVIELERSPKGRTRLRGILAAYVAARHIQGVRYVVTDDAVERLVRGHVQALHAEHLIEVVRADRASGTGIRKAA